MQEYWKIVPGLTCYEASNLGHIRRIGSSEPLKASMDKDGYMQVRLSEHNIPFTKKVHRLVAFTFIPNPNDYPMVNHKNEVKWDNRVENLEWCTAKYNSNYSSQNTYHDSIIHRMKPVIQYDLNLDKLKEYESVRSAAKSLHLSTNHIGECCNGVYKTCGGYIFRWKEDENKPISKVASMMELNIKTTRICRGLYSLYYKGVYIMIQRIDYLKWQAYLPSGWFANATIKNDCVLNAIHEMDSSEPCIEDEIAKNKDWWTKDVNFSEFSKTKYPKMENRKHNFRKD